jgi:2,3-diaminopropionate biosynthesis protein SbnA
MRSSILIGALKHIESFIGNTPVGCLEDPSLNLFVKLEYYNYSGSIKDRPAYNIIRNSILNGSITEGSTIVESSSGNFAISLATLCAHLHLKFVAVVDPNINRNYERLLNLISYKVVRVTEPDKTGGYLLTRLEMVNTICAADSSCYWTNQYGNPDNYLSYYEGLGREISRRFESLDYAFIGVSTGGTIIGLSRKLKEVYPGIKVIAVDVQGSVIFGGKPQKRHLSGLGASIVPPLLKEAMIDEVMYVSELEIIEGCHELLSRHVIFGGASTGAVYKGIRKYFKGRALNVRPNVLFLCPDRGSGYLDTVYNAEWRERLENKLKTQDITSDYALY